MPVIRVERIKIATHVAEKDDATGGRRHAALDRIISLCSPPPLAAIGVDRIDPASPFAERILLAPNVERIDQRLAGPRLS